MATPKQTTAKKAQTQTQAAAKKAPSSEQKTDQITEANTESTTESTTKSTTKNSTDQNTNHQQQPPVRTRTTNRTEGYWRGGQQHGPEWHHWPAGTFAQEQLSKLEADPHIELEAVDS
ncbi:Uncharacterised protein [BD1-7 clade bacterium]|uniref:Mu-like prophage FluMu N-terminal domain-containing protein n=1 Tax=BD1-7 clade bacterium TaxID=2029982 RepID=A0A5S9P2T4_9GAMM|nr:Uncharacterised protein [BD1-7 clade bacterium]CAA0122858.1 Uncharacterised protein [BD1-7 clade bacterium]